MIQHTSTAPPMRFFIEERNALVSPRPQLVYAKNFIHQFIDSSLFFFSVNLSSKHGCVGYDIQGKEAKVEFSSLSWKKQYNLLQTTLRTIRWEQSVTNGEVKRVKPARGKAYNKYETMYSDIPIFDHGFVWFESSKQAQLHFHMIIHCDIVIASEIRERLCTAFCVKRMTSTFCDFRKCDLNIIPYIDKSGEHEKKKYEVIDWDEFPPLWITNNIPKVEKPRLLWENYNEYIDNIPIDTNPLEDDDDFY